MCGICGFIGEVKDSKNILKKMMDKIAHRGPDDEGMYVDEHAALGHRRLSIIDLSHGAQPMYNETGDIYYLQNLFNHASPSITYRFIGEKPNMQVVLKKMTPQENEKSRYMLYLNGSGKKRLNAVIDAVTEIRDKFDDPMNNDSFYGKVDCLLTELEALMENYKETK